MQQFMKILRILLIALMMFTGWGQPIQVSRAAQSMIKQITASADKLGTYEKFELTIDLDATFKNPYDPDEISLDGQFTSPSGQKITLPGFYYDDFNLQIN